jgi:flagellar motility protein MotE (MotC chaperone)
MHDLTEKEIMKKLYTLFCSVFILLLLFIPITRCEDEKKTDDDNASSTGDVTDNSLSADKDYLDKQKEKTLKDKEAQLESKELELLEKEKLLDKLKMDIEAENKKMSQIQQNINKMMEKITAEDSKRVGMLAKIYESMKSDNAASVLVELYKKDKETTVLIIKKLQPRKSGKIMDAMTTIDKEIAANISYEISKKQYIP